MAGLAACRAFKRHIAEATVVLEKPQAGDFEARLTHIRATGQLGEMMWAVNDFADRADAYVQESRASLDAVTKRICCRHAVETGMQGAFRQAAGTINGATAAMEHKVREFGEAT
ncbi:MAG: chemotaxis protein, partial [Rhodospirillaceae bacterium]|nr:chemotaxis protein [Rhodospirillaceae bacterium]